MRVLNTLLDLLAEVVADTPGPSAAQLRGTIDLSAPPRPAVTVRDADGGAFVQRRLRIALDERDADGTAAQCPTVARVSRRIW